ncbi:hypothetical protein F4823DRAFT_623062 [Ustulina deusta]|nr:hypothetical protein F4823DRAFT_623062 [Ustulina deusta]
MTILLVALITAMAPTAAAVQFDTYYGAQPSTLAKCFFSKNITDTLYHEGNINKGPVAQEGAFQITTISILFETTSRFFADKIRARISRHFRKALASCVKLRLARRNRRSGFRFRIVLLENPLLACYLFLRIFADIYASVFSDVFWVLLSAIFGTKQLAAQRASLDEPNNIYEFGQILPVAMLVAAILTIRQSFMSGRKPPTPDPPIDGSIASNKGSRSPWSSISSESSGVTNTRNSSEGKDPQVSSVNSVPGPTPGAMVELELLLSQAKYVEAIWLLPTLFNIAVAIFLFFQIISSSGGSDAQELIVSIIISFFIVSIACCAVILVGLAVNECRNASWGIWAFALPPFVGMALLSRQVMNHAVSFGGLDQRVSLVVYLAVLHLF